MLPFIPEIKARQATYRYIANNTVGSSVTRYLGGGQAPSGEVARSAPPNLEPVAFLVEQDRDTELSAHFHAADQFQVFVEGTGYFGKKLIRPISIHYANAFTPYGPIRAGDQGVSYLTLRNGRDSNGPRFMPGARSELPTVARRQMTSDTIELSGHASDDGKIASGSIIPLEADGLGAWIIRAGPGQRIDAIEPGSGGGQYWLVLTGGMTAEDTGLLPTGIFVFPDERTPDVRAGTDGLDLLLLQFRRR